MKAFTLRTARNALLTAALTGLASATAFASVVTLSNFSFSGSGCPAPSTAKASIVNAGGSEVLRVEFEAFEVTAPKQLMKECSIRAELAAPPNKKLAVHPAVYFGNLAAKVPVKVDAGHWWGNVHAGPWSATASAPGAFTLVNAKPTPYGACGNRHLLKDDGAKGIKLTLTPTSSGTARLFKVEYKLNLLSCENNDKGEIGEGLGKDGGKGGGG
jgi:hypothetical protein